MLNKCPPWSTLTAVFQVGIMHIQLLHTSASLTINENWDPDVRDDMEMMLNRSEIQKIQKLTGSKSKNPHNGKCRKLLFVGMMGDRETR